MANDAPAPPLDVDAAADAEALRLIRSLDAQARDADDAVAMLTRLRRRNQWLRELRQLGRELLKARPLTPADDDDARRAFAAFATELNRLDQIDQAGKGGARGQ